MKIDITGLAASWTLTAVQTQEVFQIISLVLTCASTLVVTIFTLWKWYKTAKSDNKITTDEIQEGIDIIQDAANEIKDTIDKGGD